MRWHQRIQCKSGLLGKRGLSVSAVHVMYVINGCGSGCSSDSVRRQNACASGLVRVRVCVRACERERRATITPDWSTPQLLAADAAAAVAAGRCTKSTGRLEIAYRLGRYIYIYIYIYVLAQKYIIVTLYILYIGDMYGYIYIYIWARLPIYKHRKTRTARCMFTHMHAYLNRWMDGWMDESIDRSDR